LLRRPQPGRGLLDDDALRGRHRLSGEQVLLFLENIRERLTLITLTSDKYHASIKDAAEAVVIGGTDL